jgi:hypothetical protein
MVAGKKCLAFIPVQISLFLHINHLVDFACSIAFSISVSQLFSQTCWDTLFKATLSTLCFI